MIQRAEGVLGRYFLGREALRLDVAYNSSSLHMPRHLPSSGSSVISCSGWGKLKGGKRRLTGRKPPSCVSVFSRTFACVVASRSAELLLLKLATAARADLNERCMKQSLHRTTSALGSSSHVMSSSTKLLPLPPCLRRLRAISSATTSAPVYSTPPRATRRVQLKSPQGASSSESARTLAIKTGSALLMTSVRARVEPLPETDSGSAQELFR